MPVRGNRLTRNTEAAGRAGAFAIRDSLPGCGSIKDTAGGPQAIVGQAGSLRVHVDEKVRFRFVCIYVAG